MAKVEKEKKSEKMTEMDVGALLKETGNEYSSFVSDGVEAGDVTGYVDTGSYSLNAMVSGSIYGGFPNNKVTALAGAPSTGKTFFALSAVKAFLDKYPDGYVFYFESESAISKDMIEDREIDSKRMVILPVETIEQFRTQALTFLNKYLEIPKKKRQPIMLVLDSLGNLSTIKEMTDIASGTDKRDMTRAQLIRGAFRTLTLKMGRAQVPLILTNHTYDVIGAYVPTQKQGGGNGHVYASTNIVFLSKKKDREESGADKGLVVGAIITCKNEKSRLTVENKRVETRLVYATGLDRYYGLLPMAEAAGIWSKVAGKYLVYEDMKPISENVIEKNPEKYFTPEILDKIDAWARTEFLYGSATEEPDDDETDLGELETTDVV